ncbi:hypothetical protein B0O99DRAFT_630411 [Bisporella sp. PMI_857]|nr:hypothetical protein B0O99DRAFT_630411 [Bisporella sp. PMI_857]
MGRKTISWSETDENQLLANLDFVIEKVRKENREYGTTQDILRRLETALPERTQDAMSRKLKKLWRNYNKNPGPNATYMDIYRRGSRSLGTLPPKLKDQIKDQVRNIDQIQRLGDVGTPRKTRSVSRNLFADLGSAAAAQLASSERTPTKNSRKRGSQSPQSPASKRIKQELVPLSKKLFKEVTAIVHHSIEVQVPKIRTRSTPIPSEPSLHDVPSLLTSPEKEECRGTTLDGSQPLENAVQSLLYADNRKGSPASNYENISPPMPIFNTQIFAQGNETLLDLFHDNEYFRKELSKWEKRDRHVVENERFWHGIQANSIPNVVEERNNTIADLKQRLRDQAFAKGLPIKGYERKSLPNRNKIKTTHEDMVKNIMSLPMLEDILYTVDDIKDAASGDLTALISRILSNTSPPLKPDDVSLSLEVWVRSLIGAAICEWIFKESYQCVAMMNTPLLDGYRRSLSTLCNDDILRVVDSMAHQFVVKSDNFKTIFIASTAKKHAKRLWEALAPLVKGRYSSEENKFEAELEGIFRSALKIKTRGATTDYIFELIWPSRNAAFDSDFMIDEAMGGHTNSSNTKEKAKKVLLTLVPGLRAYSYERQFVDYCNFTSGNEKGLGNGDLVAHALVVTQ